MADIAVSVHRNSSDVENGTDDTEPHKETTDLNRKKESEVFLSDCAGSMLIAAVVVVN